MSKKMAKIVNALFIALMIVSVTSSVFATSISPTDINGTGASDTGVQEIKNVGNSIVNILQTVGIVISVVILIVLGIKYMMGSAEEKAEYKKTMIPYLVGAILIFAASILANVVYQFASGIA